MKNLLVKLIASMCSLMLLANMMDGVAIKNWSTALFAALAIGVVNAVIRPVLGLLTLPINLLTLGLFGFVLNALLFGLSAWLIDGFEVHGFWSALLGSLLYGLISTVLLWILDWVVMPQDAKKSL
jgi:putative membrane protein